jgi:hypothetical protein
MAASDLSSGQLYSMGLSYAGFDRSRQGNQADMRRFRAHFGVSPEAIEALIADIERGGKKVTPKNLFMAICWLKLYETEEVMAGRWDHDEKTCRLIVREYVKEIKKLKSQKITFEGLHQDCKFLGVDCIHTRVQEFRCDPDSKWWSHKFNGPGLLYEVVTDPVDGHIR